MPKNISNRYNRSRPRQGAASTLMVLSFWTPLYISTRVRTPGNLPAGSFLNWTRFGVSFLMTENTFQTGLLVATSSTP